MRTPTTMILAFLFATVTSAASAQEGAVLHAPTPPAPVVVEEATAHTPAVTIEIQGRIGGGSMWASSSDSAGIPAIEGGQAGDMNFGATLSIRHFTSGFGLTGGYTHAFTGVDTHYGTHAFDVRLSERATFLQRGNFSASFLVEAGVAFMNGSAHYACPINWSISDNYYAPADTCVDRDVSVGGIGGIGAVGVQFRYRALLAGVEADYRHLVGSGALAQQDDFMLMARVGVAFDL